MLTGRESLFGKAGVIDNVLQVEVVLTRIGKSWPGAAPGLQTY